MALKTKNLLVLLSIILAAAAVYVGFMLNTTPSEAMQAEGTDKETVLSEYMMGDKNAPIQVIEFASLSCSHCAKFHNETLPKIKENYIDTGKVKFIFRDFPLNAPALHGSMIARCLPKERYFGFLKLLFQKQDEWAFQPTYLKYLAQYAQLLGMDRAAFDRCIGNETVQKALIESIESAKTTWDISSTPSFVIDKHGVVSGARSYDSFAKVFDALLKNKEKKATK